MKPSLAKPSLGKFSLFTKLSILVTGALLLVMAVLGLYFDNFLRYRFLDDTQQRMYRGFQRLDYNLKQFENSLRDGIAFVKTDENILASVDLINNYQDKDNYNTFLIDEEKKNIAEELLSRVKLSFNSDISLYDKNGELIAYVMKDELGYQLNFLSFEGGTRKLFQRYEQHSLFSPGNEVLNGNITLKHKDYYTPDQLIRGSLITYHRLGDSLIIKSHQSIFEKDSFNVVAHIEMSKRLDKDYFAQLSKDIDLPMTPTFDKKYDPMSQLLVPNEAVPNLRIQQNEREYLGILKKEINAGEVYFVANLDKVELNQVLDESRNKFFILLVVVAALVLLLLRFVIRRTLEVPLLGLMGQIRKIEKRDYSATTSVVTGDELEEISVNVNQLALAVQEREDRLRQSKDEQQYLSMHDVLTNLPNRRMFTESLRNSMDVARRSGAKAALMFIDLDQFKVINDTLGHDVGDELLVEVSKRLIDGVTPASNHMLARIGGDEFNILIEGVQDIDTLRETVEAYLQLFHRPFICAGMELSVSASIGIAIYPKDGEDSVTLVKHADLAMYKSKDKGRNGYSFYSEELAVHLQQRSDMTHALKQALLEEDQFELFYQPKISVATGRIAAIEALIRWNSPSFGRVPPNRFINLAEETGLIVPIGKWVLLQGCKDFALLRQDGILLNHISINVSNVQLRNEDMMANLRLAIDSSGITSGQLELEITESYIADDMKSAIEMLQSIRNLGVGLAIDDFGTGYSSMSYLKKLPVTRIKIDKSFVDGLPHNKDSVSLTRAVIALAKNFGLLTTAEGVELEEQREFLKAEQCDEIQGFLYAKPMNLHDLVDYCRATDSQSANVIRLPNKFGK